MTSETNTPADTASKAEPKHVMVDRINGSLVYAMWSVFSVSKEIDGDRDAIATEAEAERVLAQAAG